MKKCNFFVYGACLIGGLFTAQSVHAQSATSLDSTRRVLDTLMKSKDASSDAMLQQDLKSLAAGSEQQMEISANYYYRLKETRTSDSIRKAMPVRFPMGFTERDQERVIIFKEKDPKVMEAKYDAWIKKFPPSNFPDINHDHISYDYVRSAIANEYAKQNDRAKAIIFINMLEEDFWKTNGYAGLAEAFQKAGDIKDYELYTEKAMAIAEKYYYDKNTDSAGKFAASGYPGFLTSYASVLYDQKEYKKALVYVEKSEKLETEMNPGTNYMYAKILMKLGKPHQAFQELETVVKAGKANPEMEATFKQLYIKNHGSEKGYDAYAAEIRKGFLEDLNLRLVKEMMNVPATNFTLTDLDGNKVTLSDYKGKIVVLDFWATWCGPCKASFPAMQMAQDKYKDDPNVKFFFIHTWEKSETAVQDAKDFIKGKGYNFEVLMDMKDPETKENKVVTSYGVQGIPSKFIIDENGIIRFHLMGFDGSNQAAVDEVSAMIEMAKKKSGKMN